MKNMKQEKNEVGLMIRLDEVKDRWLFGLSFECTFRVE